MTSCIIAQTTVDSEEAARRLAEGAVAERFAACSQIEAPITSIYRWKEKVESAREWRITFKTAADRVTGLERWLLRNHPYDTPEWICWAAGASSDYGAWLEAETR